MEITTVSPAGFRDGLGEAPHWDPDAGILSRVDYVAHAVHRLDPVTGVQTTTVLPEPASFAIPLPAGETLVGLRDQVATIDAGGSTVRVLAHVEPDRPLTRLNDGKLDPTGRLVFGTLAESREPIGGCYLLHLDGELQPVFTGVAVSNGLGWDPARARFYYVDSWTWRIDVCDIEPLTGHPVRRRPFADIDPDHGMPDGLCLDDEGGVWVALFGGGAIRRYSPEGALTENIALPVTHPTSVAFGGADLRTLYITTSRHRLTDRQRREQELAGAVLACEPRVPGQPVYPTTP